MNKCEFCTVSINQNGRFVCVAEKEQRSGYCEFALNRMMKVMEFQANSRNTKNYNINKRTENRNK